MIDVDAIKNVRTIERGLRRLRFILTEKEKDKYTTLRKEISHIERSGLLYNLDKSEEDLLIELSIKITAKYGKKGPEYTEDLIKIIKVLREGEFYLSIASDDGIEHIGNDTYRIVNTEDIYKYYEDRGIFELILAHSFEPGHFGVVRYENAFGCVGLILGKTLNGEPTLIKINSRLRLLFSDGLEYEYGVEPDVEAYVYSIGNLIPQEVKELIKIGLIKIT
jgi:hypothetical protein